jgi:hypothetical protein
MVPVSERLLLENWEFSLRHYIWRGAFIFAARFEVGHWQPLLTEKGGVAAASRDGSGFDLEFG